MTQIRRILFASDFSSASRRGFIAAITLARATRAKLTIVHAVAPIVLVPEQYLDSAALQQYEGRTRQWCTQQLARLSARAKKAGVASTTRLLHGDPAEQIVKAARSARADMIVVGTHGRRGLSKLMLGSVAARVVAAAPCPVLTVRGR